MRIIVDNLAVDIDNRTVERGDEKIKLTAKEYEVLKYLALHKDKIVSRSELLEHVWDCDYDCFSNVVDVYIRFLRAKIDDGHNKKLIKTFRKQGYSLTAETQYKKRYALHTSFLCLKISYFLSSLFSSLLSAFGSAGFCAGAACCCGGITGACCCGGIGACCGGAMGRIGCCI